ncbi:MAG: malonyl-CoA decarboxylase, partial [Sphingomonas bacterium]|nr:malonyl-CoA decarboxylase [Sphingomonas bacterium]
DVLRLDRPVIRPSDARTAVFYSISNCQEGLRGIPFGGPLIKQVVDVLRTEFPALRQAVTLSPMPGFARWLAKRAETDPVDQQLAEMLAQPGWHEDAARTAALKLPVLRAAARYLLNSRGREADAVARFHLGNGARVQQLDWLGDTSPKGLAQSHGMMVNYLYDPAHIDANYRAYHDGGTVAASSTLRKLVRDEAGASILPWRTAREYR